MTAPAGAFDSSRWDNDTRSAVRLVAARTLVQFGGPIMRAGVEFKMQDGFKTYWRYPGDSGVPPVFDFGGSENIRSVTVLWPAPERFPDGNGYSIGYKDAVLLPLRVLPKDERKPVVLRLKLDYAVCERVCVPAKANVELVLSGGNNGIPEEVMAAAEARVPKQTQVGVGQSLVISSIQRLLGMRSRVMVDVASSATKVDLFAEGPSTRWALPVPEPLPGGMAGHQRFGFDLDGLPPGAKPDGAMLRLTAVSKAGQAIEVEYRLE